MSSTTDNCNQQYSLSMHRQPSPPYDYDIEDCKAILLDEAEKLYTGLEKIIVDEIINEYVSKTSVAADHYLCYHTILNNKDNIHLLP